VHGRPLQFLHAYTGAESVRLMREHDDVAIVLMDVVMETEHAGLDAVEAIRKDLGNARVRIVLRTGQPGQAPQAVVLRGYDINDYREKTELTHARLSAVFYAGLRAWRDLMRMERARAGLRRSIDAITQVCDADNLRHFGSAVLEQAAAARPPGVAEGDPAERPGRAAAKPPPPPPPPPARQPPAPGGSPGAPPRRRRR